LAANVFGLMGAAAGLLVALLQERIGRRMLRADTQESPPPAMDDESPPEKGLRR